MGSIKLKEYLTYECINAYGIFMENKKKFDDIYEKEFQNNDLNELNKTDNIINSNISNNINLNNSNEKLFKSFSYNI